MEEEGGRRLLLTNTPPIVFSGNSSQVSTSVSSIPTSPHVPAPTQERHWSNAAVRFLLS